MLGNSGIENSKKKILLVPNSPNSEFQIVQFPCFHRASSFVNFAIAENEQGAVEIYQVLQVSSTYESWFIKNSVKSDGSLVFLAKIDPTLILINVLYDQKSNQYQEATELLYNQSYPHLYLLAKLPMLDTLMDAICDTKTVGDAKFFNFRSEKAASYVSKKVDRLVSEFEQHAIFKRVHPNDACWLGGSACSERDVKNRQRAVIKVLYECLNQQLVLLLISKYKLGNLDYEVDSKAYEMLSPEAYNTRALENKQAQSKKIKVAEKVKAVGSMKGMKTLSSFFKKV